MQDLRLPRAAVAALAGCALAVSGVLSQGVVRNPLAGPEVLGVMGGATLAALTTLIVLRPGQGGVAVAAFAGGLAALALVYAAAPRDLDPMRVALIGVAVATACAALADMLLLFAGPAATQGLVLVSGSTYAQSWSDFAVLAPLVFLCGAVAWLAARRLDALAAGDDMAISLGVPAARTRTLLLAASAILAAGAVAIVGAIVFVGLMAPHAARILVGPQHRRLLPVAAVLGGCLPARRGPDRPQRAVQLIRAAVGPRHSDRRRAAAAVAAASRVRAGCAARGADQVGRASDHADQRAAYAPSPSRSSSCVPCSTIRPDSMTTIRSAAAACVSRCATTKAVRPSRAAAAAVSSARAPLLPDSAVASSRITIG